MLYLTGSSLPSIAKYLGHKSPDVTANVYARLSLEDEAAATLSVPFLADATQRGAAGRRRNEWQQAAQLIMDPPYAFHESEHHILAGASSL